MAHALKSPSYEGYAAIRSLPLILIYRFGRLALLSILQTDIFPSQDILRHFPFPT